MLIILLLIAYLFGMFFAFKSIEITTGIRNYTIEVQFFDGFFVKKGNKYKINPYIIKASLRTAIAEQWEDYPW